MWFVNRGKSPAIGHINMQGQGAIATVGNYVPREMTLDLQGNVWFTDAANNSIVKVDPATLQTTDIAPGEGSVFIPGSPPVTPPTTPTPPTLPTAPAKEIGKVKAGKKPLAVRKNKLRVRVACPKTATAPCRGYASVRHKKKDKAFSARVKYQVKPGTSKLVTLKLKKAGKKAIKRKPVKVRVLLFAGDGLSSREKTIRVRRR